MSDNTKKAQCIHFLHFFSKDSNSTLKNHILHPHCEALKRAVEPGQSSMSQDRSIFVYNSDVLREQFAAAKQAIIDDFLKLNTNVNLTTDVWSAPHGVPGSYICVTAHWIEPDTWKMMKRVIAFEDFPTPHSGSALAKTLRNVFVNFNLENKIMSITLDNASNNTSAIASEFAFSTSGRVLSIRRTRLTPTSLEMYHLDAQERKQDKFTIETPVDFEGEILDAEVPANEAILLFDEEIALDAASSECSMSGPGSGGEEAEVNYGYDVYHDDY
nr:hypothetical protein [Tanacetum cinerariifolium]